MLEEKRKNTRRKSLISSGNLLPIAGNRKTAKKVSCDISDITYNGNGVSISCDHEFEKGQLVRLDMGGSENEIFVVKRKRLSENPINGKYTYGLARHPRPFEGISSG